MMASKFWSRISNHAPSPISTAPTHCGKGEGGREGGKKGGREGGREGGSE